MLRKEDKNMFKKMNLLFIAMSLASCVPVTETNKSKLKFVAKDKKDIDEAGTDDMAAASPRPSSGNAPSVVKPVQAELKSSVKKILDANCLSCHGDGKKYQGIANLAPNISQIGEDPTLISPGDLKNSILYQQVTVGSMKVYLNNSKDADIIKDWILSLAKEARDTKAPLITGFMPNGTTYEANINSVKLSVSTDETASCGFSVSAANLDYNEMTKFSMTNNLSHSHIASNLKAGNYSYFVKCMDAAKNVSLQKEIKFMIKAAAGATPVPVVPPKPAPVVVPPVVKVTTAELRVAVKKILDSNCMICHGAGENFQVVANLAPEIAEIENDSALISPKNLNESILYQQITNGSMKKYLKNSKDADTIKDWILSLNIPADTMAPTLSNLAPNGATFDISVTSVKLGVVTDEAAICSYSASAAILDYSKMSKLSMTGDKAHSHTVSGLKAGNYSYFLKCMDVAKNVSSEKEIKFSIKAVTVPVPVPVVVDTKAPLISSFLPVGTAYESNITTVSLSAVTDEDANCSYSMSGANLDYSKMAKFTVTGARAHSHSASNLKAGSYSYFVKCMDLAKNVSLEKVIKFSIKVPGPVVKLNTAELKVAVKKIIDANCLSCHGAGKSFQSIANLAPSIAVIEKDTLLVMPGNLNSSFIYQQVTVGKMKVYLKDSRDVDIIKDWILSLTPVVATPAPVVPPKPAPAPAPVASGFKDYSSEIQMANRSYVESILLQVFDAEGTTAAVYIKSGIYDKIEFGGACDMYAPSETKGKSATPLFDRERCTNAIGVVQPANNNPMRYSLTEKVCERLVTEAPRLEAVRNKIFTDKKWGEPTNEKVLVAWHLFHQASDADAATLEALKNIRKVTPSNDEAWKFIILGLCMSPEWQVL